MAGSYRRNDIWDSVPDEEEIRTVCKNDQIFNKGQEFYKKGAVIKFHIKANKMSAKVYDDEHRRIYDVKLAVTTGHRYNIYIECTCNTRPGNPVCRHVVAAMLRMNDNSNDMDMYGNVADETVKSLIEKATPEQLSGFLSDIMKDNRDMLHKFIMENGLKSEYGISKYAGDIASMYNQAGKRGGKIKENLDFAEQFGEARRTRSGGKHADAVRMYRIIAETISDKMDVVSNDDKYYTDCFIEALEGMVECILRERPKHEKKQEHISYLFGKAVAEKGVGFARHYRGALENICSTDEDLEFWQGLVTVPGADAGIEGERDELAEMLRMQAYILDKTGRHSEMAGLLAGHYTSLYSDICLLYLHALQQTAQKTGHDMHDAASVDDAATRAADAFPDELDVLEAAYNILSENNIERFGILERLYGLTGEWGHIAKLKQMHTDWGDAKRKIAERLAEISPENAIAFCLKENMPDGAISIFKSVADMELVLSHKSKMIKKHAPEYIGSYIDVLVKFAGSKSGKDHYRRVRDYLTAIKDMPDGDQHYKYALEGIKNKYPSRRALKKNLVGR